MQKYEIKTKPKTRNSKKNKILFYLKDNGDNRDNFFYWRMRRGVVFFVYVVFEKNQTEGKKLKKNKILFYLKDNGDNRDNFFYRRMRRGVVFFVYVVFEKKQTKDKKLKKNKIFFYLKDNGDNRDNFFLSAHAPRCCLFCLCCLRKKNSIVVIKDIIYPFFN